MEEAATHPALGLECDWPPEGGCPRLRLSSAVGVGDRHRIPSAWTRNPTSQLGGLRMVALPLCLGSPFCKIGAAGAPPRGLRRGRGRQRRAWCQHVVNLGPRRRPAWAHARTHRCFGPSPNKRGQESAARRWRHSLVRRWAGPSISEQKGQGVGAGRGAAFQSPGLCQGVGGSGGQRGAACTPPLRGPEQAASPPPPLLGG